MVFCAQCWQELTDGSKFCHHCGAPQSSENNQVPAQPERAKDRSVSVLVLSCPVCGGSLAPRAERCPFCGSFVVIMTDMPRIDPAGLNLGVINEHISGYRTTLAANPRDGEAYYGLGVAYFNLGLVKEAIRELSKAAEYMPENPNIHYQLAVTMLDERSTVPSTKDEIAGALDQALRIRPTMIEAILLKAEVYMGLKYGGFKPGQRGYRPAKLQHQKYAISLWKYVAKIDPDSIREPVARYLSVPSYLVTKRTLRSQYDHFGREILKQAVVRKRAAGSELFFDTLVRGTVTDPKVMLDAADYVYCVLEARHEFKSRNTSVHWDGVCNFPACRPLRQRLTSKL